MNDAIGIPDWDNTMKLVSAYFIDFKSYYEQKFSL